MTILPSDRAAITLVACFGTAEATTSTLLAQTAPETIRPGLDAGGHPACTACHGTGITTVPDVILGDYLDADCPCRWRL